MDREIKGFSIQGFDKQAYMQTEAYVRAVDKLYNQAVEEFTKLAMRTHRIDSDKPFAFKDYPETMQTAKNIVSQLAGKMQMTIETGSRNQWLFASKKGDAFLESIMETSKLSKAQLSKYQDRNLEALETFQKRKVDGMDLSKRVWRYANQFKDTMEMGIDVGLGEGRSAQQLSRDLRKNLLEPDRLFRRVRDKRGQLQLSKNAKAFKPGQGVYRSSHKNAMRLARSEINMGYKVGDQMRWRQLAFVVGFEIMLSNNHTLNGVPFVDICDELVGKYPKSFLFKGWHPQCRCLVIPVLTTPEEFDEDELNELRAALRGTEYKKYTSKNTVTDVPENFKTWVKNNTEASKNWKSKPYFIRDNFKGGDLSKGLKVDAKPNIVASKPKVKQAVKPKVKEVAKKVRLNAIEQNFKDVEKAINIARGKEMTFEQANELKGNVNFDKGGGYRINCQSCVVVNELRRRGFDVTAQQNTKQKDSVPYKLSYKTELAWLDKDTGVIPTQQNVGGIAGYDRAGRIKSKTLKVVNMELASITKEPGRYNVSFVWKRSTSGHIISLEKLNNGNYRFYDPQTGKIVLWSELSKQISLRHGVKILRVDDKLVNTDLVNGIVVKL